MLGSVPDAACEAEFAEAVKRVQMELDLQYGPAWAPKNEPTASWIERVLLRMGLKRHASADTGRIVCYYFHKRDFERLAKTFGVDLAFESVHRLNPFADFRFNAVFSKPTV